MNTAALILLAAIAADRPVYDLEPPPTGKEAYAAAMENAAAGRVEILLVVDSAATAPPCDHALLVDLSTWPKSEPAKSWLLSKRRPYILILSPGGPTGVLAHRAPTALLTTAQTRHTRPDGSR